MSELFLVRHGPPDINPNVPSRDWRLSEDGRLAVRSLALQHAWPKISGIYHSSEPKARDTAHELAHVVKAPLEERATLDELAFVAPSFYDPEIFHHYVKEFLQQGIQGPFAESYEEAMRRSVAAVVEISRGQTHGIPIVVSHGRILSVLESYLRGRRLSVTEWQQIPMPGVTLIDPAVPAILEPWKGIPEA